MSKNSRCKLCQMDARFSPSETNAAIARTFGVSKDSARRHRKHMSEDPFFGVPQEHISQRGITRRLDDGSYEKITWNPNAKSSTNYDLNLSEAMNKVVSAVMEHRPDHRVSDDRVLLPTTKVVIPADFQVGKVDVFGGTAELRERVEASMAGIIEDVIAECPEEIIVADVGDIIENFQNTSSQAQTNDSDLVEQILIATEIMTGIIKSLAPLCKRLVYAAVPSNHCTVRVGPKQPASTPANDYGLLIQRNIADRLSENPLYDHVTIVKPANKFEEFAVYHSPVSNTSFGFVHGHQTTKAHAIGQWLSNQASHPKNPLRDVNILIAGHFHSFNLYEDHGRWILVATSSDGGSSWFSNLTGQQSMAGITVINAVNGKWFSPNIY